MNDSAPSAAALLDLIDLRRDDSQIVQTIFSILNAPDYHQLLSSFQGDGTQPAPTTAIKLVNALDKARVLSPKCLRVDQELT